MKTQEALEILYKGIAPNPTANNECIELCKKALEKQIPKKPIKKNPICYAKTKDGQEYFAFDYFCPNCSEKIKLSEHHCKCGQALDWSDTNG